MSDDNVPDGPPVPRTQKARSIMTLRNHLAGHVPAAILAQSEDQLVSAYNQMLKMGREPFGRPCPSLPRPGFYDSCILQSEEHCRAMYQGTMDLDPEGEVVVMPFMTPPFSATWTPGLLGVGPGNDGATAGIKAISVPVAPYLAGGYVNNEASNQGWDQMIEEAGVNEHPDELQRNPHVETVYNVTGHKFKTSYVQLRAGAAAQGAGDYIPRDTTVCNLVTGPQDFSDPLEMIKWETTAKELGKSPEGVMVWCAGGHQGTHTALHCKNNGLSVCFQEDEPKIGDFFQSTDKPLPIDIGEVLRYAAAGLTYPILREPSEAAVWHSLTALKVMLTLTHGYRPSGLEARWVGAAAGIMVRLGAAALLGERRHAGQRRFTREQIHDRSFANYFNSRSKVTEAARKFNNHHWPGGFGGNAWLECTLACAELDGNIVTLARKRDDESLKALVGSLNNVLNKAHNNGWWMNKFGQKSLMDMAAMGNPTLALESAPHIYQLHCWAQEETELMHATVNRLSKSRRLRCLGEIQPPSLSQGQPAPPVPFSPVIDTATLQVTNKAPDAKGQGMYHAQFKNKKKDDHYFVHNWPNSQMSDADFRAAKQGYHAWSGKSGKSYAGSDTVYLKPETSQEKGSNKVTFNIGTAKFEFVPTSSLGSSDGGLKKPSPISSFSAPASNKYNEDEYYDKTCECAECVKYWAEKPVPEPEVATDDDGGVDDWDGDDSCNEPGCCGNPEEEV